SLPASLRSSAKPIQALLLARAREDLAAQDLAIAAASHYGTPMHVEAVRALLRETGGSEEELDCGLQEGRPPEPVYHNCSGKHAARAFSRFEGLDGGGPIAAAMRARPELVGGEGATDTELMRTLPGWIAKAGAEGLMCAASSDGVGVALKSADGNSRALRPGLAAFGELLGVDLS